MVDVWSSADTKAALAGKVAAPATDGTTGQVLTRDTGTGTGTAWRTTTASGSTPDATATSNGAVRLAGDLAGTAAAPTLVQRFPATFTVGSSTAIPVLTIGIGGIVTAATTAAPAGTAATTSTLGLVNVRDYGAKGDGSTDDAAAIKAATAAVAARTSSYGSGRVYFPPGVYPSSQRLTVPRNIKWVGEGAGASVVTYVGSADATAPFVTWGAAGTINTNGGVERMQIDAGLKCGWAFLMYGPQEGSCVAWSLVAGGTVGGIDCRSQGIEGGNNKFIIANSWVWANGSTAMYGAKFDDANGPFAIRDTTFVRTGGGAAPTGSAGIYFNGGYQTVSNVNCEQWESHTSIDAWSNYRADTLSSYGCTYGLTRRDYSGSDPAVRVVLENLTFDGATAYVRDLKQGVTVTSCKRWSNRELDSSAWNGAHMTMGTYHFWVDSSGRLRVKASAPTGDGDGTVVGAQA